MKIATNPKNIEALGYQLILNKYNEATGINLVYGEKIIVKKKLRYPISIRQKSDLDKIILDHLIKPIKYPSH